MSRPGSRFGFCAGVALAVFGSQAFALDWQVGDSTNITFRNAVTVGAAMRMQERSNDLLGKLNVSGQENLCAADDCISFRGDPEPNQRLIDAAGSFSGVNSDNGNMNYDRHDLVAATSRLVSDLKIESGDFLVRARGIGYFDPVNDGFEETHFNTLHQPRHTDRSGDIEDRFAKGYELLDAYAQYAFEVWERAGTFSVGRQLIRWGESNLVAVNSVSEINPPNQTFLRFPGIEIGRLFTPVETALLSFDLFENASLDLVYQFGWEPVEVDPSGSFFSDFDPLGGGEYTMITLGQWAEDPDNQYSSNGDLGLFSSSTFSAGVSTREPEDGGQYGAKFSYFAEAINSGTELSFYFLNYHSRLPYFSATAANETCIPRGNTNILAAYIACRGFNGSLDLTGQGLEPVPIDTMGVVLEYPEDIQMYGFSFNTNIGSFSLSGEYSFRPNVPLQVQLTDVIFSALQPALPDVDVPINGIGQLPIPILGDVIPANRTAVPDFLSVYRGHTVQANEFIHGYERMKVGQFDATLIRAFSGSNPIGADQILVLFEVGFTQVFDMPGLDELQFEGSNINRTHYSAGADGTGASAPNSLHFNPTQQTYGFADDFAWGLRTLIRMEYNDAVLGLNLKPVVGFNWDIGGIAPLPIQNFVEGRKEILLGTEVQLTQDMVGQIGYQWFTGGTRYTNLRSDRDNLAISLTYTF